jgi:hypothetical protein
MPIAKGLLLLSRITAGLLHRTCSGSEKHMPNKVCTKLDNRTDCLSELSKAGLSKCLKDFTGPYLMPHRTLTQSPVRSGEVSEVR